VLFLTQFLVASLAPITPATYVSKRSGFSETAHAPRVTTGTGLPPNASFPDKGKVKLSLCPSITH
jgi:hypothetical protein